MDTLRMRGLRILLFPVVAALFLLGWVLYIVGERQACSKALSKRKNDDYELAKKSNANDDKIEMGLIDEIVEEKIAD